MAKSYSLDERKAIANRLRRAAQQHHKEITNLVRLACELLENVNVAAADEDGAIAAAMEQQANSLQQSALNSEKVCANLQNMMNAIRSLEK